MTSTAHHVPISADPPPDATAAVLRKAIQEANGRALAAEEAAAHYQDALRTIERAATPESVTPSTLAVQIALIESLAHRALLYHGPRRRTWRDILRAKWQTWRATGRRGR